MKVAVIGSGPTGMAAASALLAHGAAVEVFDVGYDAETSSAELGRKLRAGSQSPALLRELRRSGPRAQRGLLAAVRVLLGRRPPPKMVEKTRLGSDFTFRGVDRQIPLDGAAVPRSLARGGLSNVWGAACYALRSEDYARWPVPKAEMAAHYRAAASLLSLEEARDDLAAAYPVYTAQAPTAPIVSRTAATLLGRWERNAAELHRLGVHFGRARTAVRRRDEVSPEVATEADLEAGRVGCQRCGLCLWGCPWDAIYRSTRTLATLRTAPGFTYRPGFLVRRVRESEGGSFLEGTESVGPYDAIFLAAGALSSLRIAAESVGAYDLPRPVLDNNMHLLPSVRVRADSADGAGGAFGLSEAVMSFSGRAVGGQAVHVQLYSYGEILAQGLRASLAWLPAALTHVPMAMLDRVLVAFVYLHSDDSMQATASVVPGPEGSRIRLDEKHPGNGAVLRRTVDLLRRHRRAFGFLPVALLQNSPVLGFSGHLCGTLPMRREPGPLDTHVDGRLGSTRALYVVDASTFPVLPAQNPTYTAMANAHRIATAYAVRSREAGLDRMMSGERVS